MGRVFSKAVLHCAARTRGLAPILRAAFPLIAIAMGGCSVHPIQQDVTQIPTKQIVDHIRCEVKLSVMDKAIEKLLDRANKLKDEQPPRLALADKFAAIAGLLSDAAKNGGRVEFDPTTLPDVEAIKFYNHFINTGLAYDFTFDVSEMNNSALAVDPVRLITNGTAGITVGAGMDLTRNNIRRFTLTDTFAELLLLPNEKLPCRKPEGVVYGNFTYPVAGDIGLHELISTFVDLSEAQLQKKSAQDASVFGDTLKFTTNVTGGVTPHVLVSPVGNRFGLAAPATFKLAASRNDIHTLAISLSMGAEGDVPLVRGPSRGRVAGRIQPMPLSTLNSTANVNRALRDLKVQRDRNLTDALQTLISR